MIYGRILNHVIHHNKNALLIIYKQPVRSSFVSQNIKTVTNMVSFNLFVKIEFLA